MWELGSGRCEHVLRGHTDDVRGVSASSDGRVAASCSFDKTLRVWDLTTGQEVSTLEGHTDKVFGVAMSGDGGTVVSCSWDMSVRVWDVLSGQAVGKPIQPPSLMKGLANLVSSLGIGTPRSSSSRGSTGGRFVDLASLNVDGEDALLQSKSTKDRLRELIGNREKKEKRDKAQRQGFVVDPVEASGSTSVQPELVSYSSSQVTAHVLEGKKSCCIQSGMLQAHEKEVLGVSISQNGLRCASCSVDGTVRMWDLTTGTQVARCEGHSDWVWGVSMTADGQLVASCGKDHSARIWTFDGSLRRVVQHKGEVLGVALSSDHRLLVTGQGKSVFVWLVKDGEKVVELKKHSNLVRGVAVNESGTRLASASKDCTVIVWEINISFDAGENFVVDTANVLFVMEGHTALVRSVQIRGDAVISCASDKTIRLWNIETGECEATLCGHTDDVRDVCMNSDRSVAVSCSFDRTVRVWDLHTHQEAAVLAGHTDKVFGVAINAEGSVAISCSWDMSIRIWDIDIGQQLGPPTLMNSVLTYDKLPTKHAAKSAPASVRAHATCDIKAHESEIFDVAICNDGSEAITCSIDGSVRLWDLDSGEQLANLTGHSDWAWGVVMTADGSKAASCGRDKRVIVWDLMLRRAWKTLVHASEVMCVGLSDDATIAATGSGKQVLAWNVRQAAQTASLMGHTQTVRCVAVANPSSIISGSQDTTLRVWARGPGAEHEWTCLRVLDGHAKTVRGIAVQAQVVVSGSQDETVRAWNLQTGQCMSTMSGHSGDIRSVALSVNGLRAVSGSFDHSVRVWDMVSGQEVSMLAGHTDKVSGVGLSADGSRAVSCSWDASLRVWDLLSDNPADLTPGLLSGQTGASHGLLGTSSLVDAVKGALGSGAAGGGDYDQVQSTASSTSSSDESGRSTPQGPLIAGTGEGIGNLGERVAGRRRRIRVDVEEESLTRGDKESEAGVVGSLGEAIQRFLGRSDDVTVELDEDEKEWRASVLAQHRLRRGHEAEDLENAHEMSQLMLDVADEDDEEDIERLWHEKDKMRHRSSLALALGFVCFFPWFAGLVLGGGVMAKDRLTRNINRVSVLLLCAALAAAASILAIRFTIKDNVFCQAARACDRVCAVPCAACADCIRHGHWWCHQPRANETAGFCAAADVSRDDFTMTEAGAKSVPAVACSRGCGCDACLSQDGNWCRHPLSTRATANRTSTSPASAASPRRVQQWGSGGDDGYCDLLGVDDDRFASLTPHLCTVATADNASQAKSCCCDSTGCHPTKCTSCRACTARYSEAPGGIYFWCGRQGRRGGREEGSCRRCYRNTGIAGSPLCCERPSQATQGGGGVGGANPAMPNAPGTNATTAGGVARLEADECQCGDGFECDTALLARGLVCNATCS